MQHLTMHSEQCLCLCVTSTPKQTENARNAYFAPLPHTHRMNNNNIRMNPISFGWWCAQYTAPRCDNPMPYNKVRRYEYIVCTHSHTKSILMFDNVGTFSPFSCSSIVGIVSCEKKRNV